MSVLLTVVLIVFCLGPGFLAGWVSQDLADRGSGGLAVVVFLSGGALTYLLCYGVLYPSLEVLWR